MAFQKERFFNLFLFRFSAPPPCPVFFISFLLTNFSSGVTNALKALDRAFLTFCLSFAEFVSLGIATSYGG